jgi:signal transduction histidine kinase
MPLAVGLLLAAWLGFLLWPVRRSPRPARLRYRMSLMAAPLWFVAAGLLLVDGGLRGGFHWKLLLAAALIPAWAGFLVRHLRRARLAAQRETPRVPGTTPRLWWPFAAILGPMLLLAVMAAWTLRADRRAVEQDARTRAADLAAAISAKLEESLRVLEVRGEAWVTREPQDYFLVNGRFELAYPIPRVWPPEPQPLTERDFAGLAPQKVEQWQAAEAAEAKGDWSAADRLYRQFLEKETRHWHQVVSAEDALASCRLGPMASLRHAAIAEKTFATLGTSHAETVIASYDWVFARFWRSGGGRAESGVSHVSLAILKILEVAQGRVESLPPWWREDPEAVVRELANQDASPLADECIRRLRALAASLAGPGTPRDPEQLFVLWDHAERARRRYAEAAEQLAAATNGWPDQFWVERPIRWLAVRQPLPGRASSDGDERIPYACIAEERLARQIGEVWQKEDRRGDFTVRVEIAGQPVRLPSSPPPRGEAGRAGEDWRGAEFAARERSPDRPLLVTAGLANPGAYFDAVERRQWLLGSMLVLALAAGAFASITLRNSLLRQLRLNEQKSNFVSSVSHELRAPIASVRLLAESLARGKVLEPARQQEYFRLIGQEAQRLSSLIANVLDFSRIEQGRKQYEFERMDLRALVEATVKLMQPQGEERGVCVRCEIRDPKCEMETDGRAIQQALVNLLDNAIKHSPRGETVTVALESRTGVSPVSPCKPERRSPVVDERKTAGTVVLLSVADHGPGIPASEHERIFERFHRLGSELRRETQGVGIGLSIVKHIVEAHRGRVIVESQLGKGSRFTIELPEQKSEARRPKAE